MTITTVKIGFIGGGNMAQALIGGLLAKGVPPQNIMVSDPVADIRALFESQKIPTTQQNNAVITHADVIVLAIKPQLFEPVLSPLKGLLTDRKLVISIAAGVSTDTIAQLLAYPHIVRAMPNTPALIQMGATGIYAPDTVSDRHKDLATAILSASGLTVWVDTEDKIHGVTAISGSGPAYFFYLFEHMIQQGIDLGLNAQQAKDLVLQTALGAAQMAKVSTDSPTTLRQKVTSPNGTTHAAITTMQQKQVGEHIATAMQACHDRSIELGKT